MKIDMTTTDMKSDTIVTTLTGTEQPSLPTTTEQTLTPDTHAVADPLAALRAQGVSDAQINQLIKALASRGGGKVARECACGCKMLTKGGKYRPGHDAKHMSQILRGMRA